MVLEKILKKTRNAMMGVGLSGALMLSGCGTFLYGLVEEAGRETGRQFVQETIKENTVKEDTSTAQPQNVFLFSCNYYNDFNKNGLADYPDDFVGIKNRFKNYEKILLVAYDRQSKKGELGRVELYNPYGELIGNGEHFFQLNGNVLWLFFQPGGTTGNFKFVYFRNNKYIDSREFVLEE